MITHILLDAVKKRTNVSTQPEENRLNGGEA